MSWSMVLSNFPKSILGDKWPLLILSIIDRSGLSTEDELSKNLGVELPKIKSNLLKLKLNDLIEYGSNHVKLSVKGNQLLDRLDLQDDVLSDFLDSLNFSEEERVDFEKLLKEYRKTSLSLYQNSLCTIRQWKNIANHFQKVDENIYKQITNESEAGLRCLLYRDLRNWISHYKPSQSMTNSLGDQTQLILFIDNLDDSRLYKGSDFTHNCAIDYLRKIKSPVNKKYKIQTKYYLLETFNNFNHFQSCYEPDVWFDKWSVEIKLPSQKKYRKTSNYIKSLNNIIIQYIPFEFDNSSITSRLQKHWRHTSSAQATYNNIFEDLFLVKDIPELSERTGLSEESVKIMLEKLLDTCQKLLKETSGKKKVDDAQPANAPDPKKRAGD